MRWVYNIGAHNYARNALRGEGALYTLGEGPDYGAHYQDEVP